MFGAGLTFELVARKAGKTAYRATVGLIGTEDNPANLLYGGVLVVNAVFVMLFVGSAMLFRRATAVDPDGDDSSGGS